MAVSESDPAVTMPPVWVIAPLSEVSATSWPSAWIPPSIAKPPTLGKMTSAPAVSPPSVAIRFAWSSVIPPFAAATASVPAVMNVAFACVIEPLTEVRSTVPGASIMPVTKLPVLRKAMSCPALRATVPPATIWFSWSSASEPIVTALSDDASIYPPLWPIEAASSVTVPLLAWTRSPRSSAPPVFTWTLPVVETVQPSPVIALWPPSVTSPSARAMSRSAVFWKVVPRM